MRTVIRVRPTWRWRSKSSGETVAPRKESTRAPIATYWLLDLNSRTLEVYTQPHNDDYANLEILCATDHVTLTLNAQAVASLLVADLLP